MDAYWCRVSVPFDIVKDAMDRIASKSSHLIVYEHNETPDNIHIHFYVENCEVSTDTLKNYIKKCGYSGGKRGSGWSFARARDRGCIVYATKGKLDPVYNKGFTDEEVQEYRLKWIPKESVSKGKVTYTVKESPVESRKRQWDLVQEIVKRFNQLDIKTGRQLCEIIRKVVIIDNKTVLGRYKLRDYYDTVKAIVNEKEWSLSAAQFCEKDFF